MNQQKHAKGTTVNPQAPNCPVQGTFFFVCAEQERSANILSRSFTNDSDAENSDDQIYH